MTVRHRWVVVAALLVGTACGDGDDGPHEADVTTSFTSSTTATTVEPIQTTDGSSSTDTAALDPDTQAAIEFIDAWVRADAAAMRELAPDEQVEIAMGLGTPDPDSDCSNQASGQYQCVVDLSSGKRAYLLVGEPGDRAGRVWWIAEYVPGT